MRASLVRILLSLVAASCSLGCDLLKVCDSTEKDCKATSSSASGGSGTSNGSMTTAGSGRMTTTNSSGATASGTGTEPANMAVAGGTTPGNAADAEDTTAEGSMAMETLMEEESLTCAPAGALDACLDCASDECYNELLDCYDSPTCYAYCEFDCVYLANERLAAADGFAARSTIENAIAQCPIDAATRELAVCLMVGPDRDYTTDESGDLVQYDRCAAPCYGVNL